MVLWVAGSIRQWGSVNHSYLIDQDNVDKDQQYASSDVAKCTLRKKEEW
jgi:hypothetical protein